MNLDHIEGRNPVVEALKAGREIDKLMIQKDATGSIVKILTIARERKVPVHEVPRQKLDAISETGAHQGVIALVPSIAYADVDDILELARKRGEPPFILIAEEINDPGNLGAMIRSANAAGVHGVIISKRRGCGVNSTVAKASAGAVEYTPVARVANIAMTVERLKKEGLWIVAGDSNGEKDIYKSDLKGPLAVVIGSEGQGISRLVKEKCDFIVRIPMYGRIESLNASVAASILMFEAARQRNL